MNNTIGKGHKPRLVILLLLLLIVIIPQISANTNNQITFSGGFTKAVMREGRESIILTQGAVVTAGSVRIEAETIELSGKNSRYLTGTENVMIEDNARGLTITASNISYDRELELILIDSWVEILDLENEVIASGAFLSYDQAQGTMKLQIAVRLLHHTESGAMVCRADTMEYNRQEMTLALTGNSSVYWKGDSYEASSISIDLNTEEIRMEGSIKGTVHGG
jgi:lipopolysaccharide export system protein LptA